MREFNLHVDADCTHALARGRDIKNPTNIRANEIIHVREVDKDQEINRQLAISALGEVEELCKHHIEGNYADSGVDVPGKVTAILEAKIQTIKKYLES